jgi:hypothetical protein
MNINKSYTGTGSSISKHRFFCSVSFFNGSSSQFRALASHSLLQSFFTDGRTPWTSDRPVAKPLPKHRTEQTQNKRIHTANIHALSGIRTHDPSFRAIEGCSCLRPRGYCVHYFSVLCALESTTPWLSLSSLHF